MHMKNTKRLTDLYIKKHNSTIEIICYKNSLNINNFDYENNCLRYTFIQETRIGLLKASLCVNSKFKYNLFTNNTENIRFKGSYNNFGMRFNYFFDRGKLQLGDGRPIIIEKDIIIDNFFCKVAFSTNASRLLKEAYCFQNNQNSKKIKRTTYGCYNPRCYYGGSFNPK